MRLQMEYLKRYNELLGMEFSKANRRLHQLYLFSLIQRANKDICYRCGNKIENAEDFSIEHKISWIGEEKDNKDLYFNLSNICASHLNCNCAASQAYKGKSKYVGVHFITDKRTGYQTWRSTCSMKRKIYDLGCYQNEEDAAEARDLGILKYCNGVGLINFPDRKDKYRKMIEKGWGDPPKCKICGDKHFGLGYCRKHHYELCGGKEKRRQRYLEEKI